MSSCVNVFSSYVDNKPTSNPGFLSSPPLALNDKGGEEREPGFELTISLFFVCSGVEVGTENFYGKKPMFMFQIKI